MRISTFAETSITSVEESVTELLDPDAQPLTARLAAAGSRRQELEAVLAAAPRHALPKDFAELVLQQNVAGKASAVSRAKLLGQLRARYLLDSCFAEFRAFQAAMVKDRNSSDRGLLCYLMIARSDRLMREASLLLLEYYRVKATLDAKGFKLTLEEHLQENDIQWTSETVGTVARHVLSSLKDFGILSGSQKKYYAAFRPGSGVILFAARLADLEGLTGRQTLSSRWFRLLRLEKGGAANALLDAHRAGLLSFRMQAEVVELALPPMEVA